MPWDSSGSDAMQRVTSPPTPQLAHVLHKDTDPISSVDLVELCLQRSHGPLLRVNYSFLVTCLSSHNSQVEALPPQ